MAHYPLTLTEDGDTFLVTSPSFPELTTFGETREEAIIQGEKALMEAIAARIDAREAIPGFRIMMAPDQAVGRIDYGTEAKINLHNTMLHEKVNRAELARRMDVKSRESVDRLLRLDHVSKPDQLLAAFNALGYETMTSVRRRA